MINQIYKKNHNQSKKKKKKDKMRGKNFMKVKKMNKNRKTLMTHYLMKI